MCCRYSLSRSASSYSQYRVACDSSIIVLCSALTCALILICRQRVCWRFQICVFSGVYIYSIIDVCVYDSCTDVRILIGSAGMGQCV